MKSETEYAVGWIQKHKDRWERHDNAVVLYDHSVACDTSRPWLRGHRGWKAFGPGPQEYNYLYYERTNKRRRPSKIARKYKTAAAAMAAVDREHPQNHSHEPHP